jgi:hypothetical protein
MDHVPSRILGEVCHVYSLMYPGLTLAPRPIKYDAQERDRTATPRRKIWTVDGGGLRLTELADPTDTADDPDQRG